MRETKKSTTRTEVQITKPAPKEVNDHNDVLKEILTDHGDHFDGVEDIMGDFDENGDAK